MTAPSDDERQEAADTVRRLREEANAIRSAGIGPKLAAPGCERGCPTCYRGCAVKRINLGWWERELARLGGDPSVPALAHGGVVYAECAGRA